MLSCSVISGSVISGFVISGFVISGFVISGSVISGSVISGSVISWATCVAHCSYLTIPMSLATIKGPELAMAMAQIGLAYSTGLQ